MILLTLSRGKGEETVRLQLPASPAEIGETFAFLDRISLDTTATAILDVSSNVPVLYRCLYDVDVEDSEQFQKLQKLAERTEALSPAKAAIFSGALDAECVWNLEGALTVADRLDEYMLVNNVSSDSELGIYLVNKGIIPFPDRFKPYINYARVGAEYREKHGGEYSSGNYVQKKTPELLENERLDGVFRIWMENPCPVRVQSETAQITLPATFEQLESARQLLGVDSLNMAKLTRVEALRPYLGEYLPLQGMDLRLEQLDELAENIRIWLCLTPQRRAAAFKKDCWNCWENSIRRIMAACSPTSAMRNWVEKSRTSMCASPMKRLASIAPMLRWCWRCVRDFSMTQAMITTKPQC